MLNLQATLPRTVARDRSRRVGFVTDDAGITWIRISLSTIKTKTRVQVWHCSSNMNRYDLSLLILPSPSWSRYLCTLCVLIVLQVRLLCSNGAARYLPVDCTGGCSENRQLVVRFHRVFRRQLRRIRYRGVHARGHRAQRLHRGGAESAERRGRQDLRRHHPAIEQEA